MESGGVKVGAMELHRHSPSLYSLHRHSTQVYFMLKKLNCPFFFSTKSSRVFGLVYSMVEAELVRFRNCLK